MLFGAGFGLQYIKSQSNQPPFIKKYRRRLGFLLMFGVCHALLWSGDILTLYALLAFVLVMLRNLDYEKLLPAAVILLCAFALPQVAMLILADTSIPTQALAHKTYSDMSPRVISDAFGGGSWSDMFMVNLHNLYWRGWDFLPNGRISRVLGLFFLGFYLARSGYFVRGIYRRLHLLALAYMSILAQAFSLKIGQTLLFPLTLSGRMAFTSYLMQSVIGIALFSGAGAIMAAGDGYLHSPGIIRSWLDAFLHAGAR